MSVLKYHYRKLFGLTAYEMELEPADELFTNLYIFGQINLKERKEAENG